MKWKKYTLNTRSEVEDIVTSMLYDLGIEGAEVVDKTPLTALEKEQMFVDILPDFGEDDGNACLNFYLDEDDDCETIINNIKAELLDMRSYADIGEGTIEESETEDKDWINNWKQYFGQFNVDDILIVPSWEEKKDVDKYKLVLTIDPGTAFGTGMHETTQLCIRAIRKYLNNGDSVLDVGTGSGILSIVALHTGAKNVLATDLDPCAIEAFADNMDRNNLSDADAELIIGNIIDDKEVQDRAGYEKYDMVCANILAEVLIPLTPVVLSHIKKGGIYITSGIIEDKAELVAKAIKDAGFEILEINHQGEWAGIVARK